MKKLLGVAIALALCLAVAPGAFAIDDGSLEKMTTEGLYDRNDAYDHALEPGLLYHLDRWRLYTNLSAYDGDSPSANRPCCFEDWGWDSCNWDDEGSYLIGTSGPLGTGNVAFLYETNKYKFDGLEYDTDRETDEDTASYPYSERYDGVAEWEYTGIWVDGAPDSWFFQQAACPTCTDNVPSAEGKIEENNFYLAYGMDFDGFSLGLSYAPEMRDEEVSMRVRRGYGGNSNAGPPLGNYQWGTDFYEWMGGSTFFGRIDRNYDFAIDEPSSRQQEWLYYLNQAHTDYYYSVAQADNSGKLDRDINIHPVNLQSHVRLWTDWDILMGIGYASIEKEDDFKATIRESGSSADGTQGLRGVYFGSTTIEGSLCEDRDGDEWSIFVSPTRVINDLVSVRLDLFYANEDGDLKGGTITRDDYTEIYYGDTKGVDDAETWHFTMTEDESGKADYEIEKWAIEPRVYLTFDKVRFALGAGYRYEDEEITGGEERDDVRARFTYDHNSDGLNDFDDRIYEGEWTTHTSFGSEVETETWRFPVATEFMVTDKLTFRAGAAYYRQTIEGEQKSTELYREKESYRVLRGDGQLVGGSSGTGPEDQIVPVYPTPPGGNPTQAYDATTDTYHERNEFELTLDWTTYNLGLGYQFTENLQVDLMWEGKGESGGVDMTDVFASITLAF